MNYYISRGGQQYGPYTLSDLRRYLSEGSIVVSDLARSEDSQTWVPVMQILGRGSPPAVRTAPPIQPGSTPVAPLSPGALAAPLPPELHWALVLLFTMVTCGLFGIVWALVQAGWVKKIVPRSNALLMYGMYVAFLLLGTAVSFAGALGGPEAIQAVMVSWLFTLAALVCLLVGAFNIRSCLLEYYNSVEPIGLRLSAVMTFFFNTLYFQYHMSRIHRWKTTGVLTPQG